MKLTVTYEDARDEEGNGKYPCEPSPLIVVCESDFDLLLIFERTSLSAFSVELIELSSFGSGAGRRLGGIRSKWPAV